MLCAVGQDLLSGAYSVISVPAIRNSTPVASPTPATAEPEPEPELEPNLWNLWNPRNRWNQSNADSPEHVPPPDIQSPPHRVTFAPQDWPRECRQEGLAIGVKLPIAGCRRRSDERERGDAV